MAEGEGTDAAAALRAAAAWAGARRPARVVLLGDGRSTRSHATEEAARLRAAGVELVARGFPEGEAPPPPPSLRLLALRAPVPERCRGPFALVATAEAAGKCDAEISLWIDGLLHERRPLALAAGTTSVSFEEIVLPPGLHFAQALLGGGADPIQGEASTVARVPGDPRVLCIAAEARDALLQRALETQGMEVEVTAASEALDLEGFDAVVILPEAPAAAVEAMAPALSTFVGRKGGGLLGVGGAGGEGLGRLHDTAAGFLFPLACEPRPKAAPPAAPDAAPGEEPRIEPEREKRQAYPISLCLLLDRSGSMAGDKLERARQAAAAAAIALTAADRISIVTFGDRAEVLVEPRTAGDPAAILRALGNVEAEGNTAMFEALSLGYRILLTEGAPVRHLLLVSDGRSTDEGRWKDLIQEMAGKAITLSTVGVGFDLDLRLPRFAEWGRGRWLTANHPHEIPQVVTFDALRVVRERDARGRDAEQPAPPREEKPSPPAPPPDRPEPPSFPELVLRADPGAPRDALAGVPDEELPKVAEVEEGAPRFAAWVAARAGDAETPVLAYWRYGLGTAAALTVDPEAPSARALREHPEFSRILAQLVRSLLPDAPRETILLEFAVEGEDGEDFVVLRLVAEDGLARTDLPMEARWGDTFEGGRPLALARRAGTYRGALPPGEAVGRLHVRAGDPQAPLLARTIVLPRSLPREMLARGTDLEALGAWTGSRGRFDAAADELLRSAAGETKLPRPAPLPFLLLAAILLPLDAWARRNSGSR
ncbi:MAG: vWA domain-containing protein [Planctomycetaceae bacterium]